MEITKNQNKFFVSYDYLQILADGYYNIYIRLMLSLSQIIVVVLLMTTNRQ